MLEKEVYHMWRKLSLVLVLVASFGLSAVALADDGDIGWVKTLAGEAAIVRDSQRVPAVLGQSIRQGDRLETGADGTIGVTFTDNTAMSIGPNSSLWIDQYSYDAAKFEGGMLADLLKGTLAVTSGDIPRTSPEAMRVRTPSAILGVRGTKFLVRAAEPKKS